jgi:uncharacterized repeat protein (TIGR02543 family)
MIYFDGNGGSASPAQKQVTYAAAVGPLPTPPQGVSRAGYSFQGWRTSPDSDTGEEVTPDSIHPTTASVTLYATWSPLDLSIAITKRPAKTLKLYRLGGGKNTGHKVYASATLSDGSKVAPSQITFTASGKALTLKNNKDGSATLILKDKGTSVITASCENPATGEIIATSINQKVTSKQVIKLSKKTVTIRAKKKTIITAKIYDNGKRVRPKLKAFIEPSKKRYATIKAKGRNLIVTAKKKTNSPITFTIYTVHGGIQKSAEVTRKISIKPALVMRKYTTGTYYSQGGRLYPKAYIPSGRK